MTLASYSEQILGELKLPDTLVKLYKFESDDVGLYYCNRFELCHGEVMGLDIDGMEDEYYESIKPFAYVDSGCCAFWMKKGIVSLDDAPIIYYSSEGFIRIMAKNLKDFLRMLTFDASLDDGTFYKDKKDYKESKYKHEYIHWLKKEFGLDPVADLKQDQRSGESYENIEITLEAEKLHKKDFLEWHLQFCDISDQYCC